MRTLTLLLLPLLAGTTPAAAQVYRVATGRVAAVCPLTVGGRFEATTDAVSGSATVVDGSAQVSGSFAVDLRTLTTGIGLRDRHLRENYLEVARGAGYERAALEHITLDAPHSATATGVVGFTGQFTLHGQTRPVGGTAEVVHKNGTLQVTVRFPLRIDAFQIPSPTYLGVGVSNDIAVEVRAALHRVPAATGDQQATP